MPLAEMRRPPLGKKGGPANVTGWLADDLREYSAPIESAEAFAVAFIARRYRIAPPLARVICGLAQIGARVV